MYLSEYQTFQSKQQLNEAVSDHLAMHRYNLTETVRKVLTVISRYAVKFPGVAHLKAATIAESIGMSEKTVRRAVNHLQDLRIVRKVVTNRKVSGGQGANIMQILPFENVVVQAKVSKREEAVKPVIPSVQPSENSSEPYYSLKQNNVINNTYSAYVQFAKMVGNFVSDQKQTNKLYGIYLAQTVCLRTAYEPSELLSEGIGALKIAFSATKRKAIHNLCGFYSGVLTKRLDVLLYETMDDVFAEV